MNTIRDFTERFWRDSANIEPLPKLQRYIRDLLPKELKYARADKSEQRLPDQSYDVLVLLVGHAFEPLLQSICAYKPTEVLLVLNRWYSNSTSGNDMAKRLEKCLPKLKGVDGLETPPTVRPYIPVDDTPSAVFQYLLGRLRDDWSEKRSVVVDITGAKKSMVAGAFFLAAYANVPISYVDFDEYSERYSRPYGYTCNIGLIDNPYRDFRLRDWARVRRLYRQYAFGAARNSLKSVQQAMERSGYFTADQIAATNQLVQVLEVYEHWDNGDYFRAKEKANKLRDEVRQRFPLPRAVEELGDKWPHTTEDTLPPEQAANLLLNCLYTKLDRLDRQGYSFFLAPEEFAVYVVDELCRVQRLLGHDYRSAMMRAVGLYELLLQARALALWKGGLLEFSQDSGITWTVISENNPPSPQREKLYDRLRDAASSRLEGLLTKDGKWVQFCLSDVQTRIRRRIGIGPPVPSNAQLPTLIKKVRDKTTHRYMFVPGEVAQKAFCIAARSLKDYADNWATLIDPGSTRPQLNDPGFCELPWQDLCTVSNIDFLPPYLEEDE